MRYRQGGGQSSRSTVRFRVSEPVFHTHPWLMARVMALSWVRFLLTITAWIVISRLMIMRIAIQRQRYGGGSWR